MESNATEQDGQYNTILTEIAATASPMSPDTNHNEIIDNKQDMCIKLNGIHKEAAVPEEMLNNKGLILYNSNRIPTTGGTAEEVPNEHISAKTAVGEHVTTDDENVKKYLNSNDTVVIFPKSVWPSDDGEYSIII